MRKVLLIILTILMVLSFGAACSQPDNTKKYSVTYQSGEGVGQDYTVEVKKGSYTLLDPTELEFIAPTYKAFDYWQIGDPKTAEKQVGDTITVSADTTIIAVWKETRAQYTISYQAGEGVGDEETVSVFEGDYTLLAYTALGFTAPVGKEFDYWQIGETNIDQMQAGDILTITSNVTIIAVWKDIINEYQVTYKPGEGSGSVSEMRAIEGNYTLLEYTVLGFTAPTGKEFDYWQIGEPKTAEKQAGETVNLTDDLTIVAVWTIKTDATLQLAIGKTVDLGSLYTDSVLGKNATWQIVSGSNYVKLATGGDNLQAVSEGEAILSATAGSQTYIVKVNAYTASKAEDVVDFVVDVPTGRDIRVLQITDTQLVDSAQASMSGLSDQYTPERFEENCFKYIREAVRRTTPDLIIMTGDNVWGSFDDNGTALQKLIEVLDSFQVPWAGVYGNHDNETEKGAQWQNEQYQHSQYGLFLRGVTNGNGNYTVGIKQGNEIKRVFVMMDTNLCSGAHNPAQNYVTTTMGFTDDQVKWFNRTTAAILGTDSDLKISMGYHVPNYAFDLAMAQYEADLVGNTNYYTLGLDVEAKDGDFGSNNCLYRNGAGGMIDYENGQVKKYEGKTLLELYKQANVDSVFVGHQHANSNSMVYEGIRWTFGLKTSIYDHMNRDNIGGTLITVDDTDGAVTVKHIYYDEDYQAYRDGLLTNPINNLTVAGAEVGGKDKLIYPDSDTRMNVVREYVKGYGAYKVDSMTQRELRIDNSLIEGKASMTFSYLVPSNCTNNISGMSSPFTVYMYGTSAHYVWFKPIKNGTGDFNYDEWTTATIDFNFNGDRSKNVRWILAPESAIYLKDIAFIDAEPKSDVAISVTVNKDGVEDTDLTLKNKIEAYLTELYYLTGDTVDIRNFVKENIPKGFKIDEANSTFSAEVPATGTLSFVVSFVTYVEETVVGTGNLVKTLRSNGYAWSKLTNSETEGGLFNYGTEQYLYFNCLNPSLANHMIFDSDFVQDCFSKGYTSIKVKYFVDDITGVSSDVYIKIGPQIRNSAGSIKDLTARASSPWLDTKYNSDNMIEQIWDLTPQEVLGFDFANGDQLVIGNLGMAAPKKSQVIFTHFEFCKPLKPFNYVQTDLFNADTGIMGKVYNCSGSCWIQHYDADAETYGSSKVVDIRRETTTCKPVIYFKQDFLNTMLNAGYTELTIRAGYTTNYGRTKASPILYDYDLGTGFNSKMTYTKKSAEDPTTLITTYKFDLTGKTINNYLAIYPSTSTANAVMYIYEISFSVPYEDYSENLVEPYCGISGRPTGLLKEYHQNPGDTCQGWTYCGSSTVNVLRVTGCALGIEIDSTYVAKAISAGYTKLNLTWKHDSSRTNTYPQIKSGASLTELSTIGHGDGVSAGSDGYKTKTFDLSSLKSGDVLVIVNAVGGANLMVKEISFSK